MALTDESNGTGMYMPVAPIGGYYSGTEFSGMVDGRTVAEIMPIIDELMSVLQATNPRLYAGVLRTIEQ